MADRVAVITGAGSGIGRASALALCKDGWSVALLGRRKEALEETAGLATGGKTLPLPTDVTEPDQVIAAAGSGDDLARFYAQLYAGLYYEAIGDAKRALTHITAAADVRFSSAGYMHGVARVHRDVLKRRPPPL